MPHWTTRDELAHQVVMLSRQGMKLRAIARALGISRNTVRKMLAEQRHARQAPHPALPPPPPHAPRPQKLDPFRARIAELLAHYPDITAQRVFEELRAAGYDGGYTQIKEYVHKTRPAQRVEPSRPTPRYGPGEMAESDWSSYTIDFTRTGKKNVQAFAYVACFSHRKYFHFYERSDFYALLDGHVHAFECFQGALRHCKYDGQKAVVLGWEGKQPLYNPRFLAFATYYEFRPVACRPRHPNDKPHVERAFWELERSFFNGRSFRDLDDLRDQLTQWQRTVCDVRPHKELKRTPLELFVEEGPHLVPLPCHPYDTARVVYRVCSVDGFIAWDGNRYAVPYPHITDLLPVRVTQSELFVYAADLRLLARHQLAPRSAGQEVDPQGFHSLAERRGAGREQLQQAFADMGPEAADFFTALTCAQPRQAGYHARQILILRERYATADLCAALRHARSFGALDHRAVARILAARAQPRSLAEYLADEATRHLYQVLGTSRTVPRDLAEYDPLPARPSPNALEDPCPNDAPPKDRPRAAAQTAPTTISPSGSDDTSSSSG
jgi:transposase